MKQCEKMYVCSLLNIRFKMIRKLRINNLKFELRQNITMNVFYMTMWY